MKMKTSSPSITQRVLVEHTSGESIPLSTPAFLSLARKSGKSDIPLTILEQVYCRGILTADQNSQNTVEQQAFQRVDSFIHEGKAFELDYDLIEECPKVPDGTKHMHIIKKAIKNHEARNKPEQVDENLLTKGLYALGHKVATGHWTRRGLVNSPEYQAKRLARRKEAIFQANKTFQSRHPELTKNNQSTNDGGTSDIAAKERARLEGKYKAKQDFQKSHPELVKKEKPTPQRAKDLSPTQAVDAEKFAASEVLAKTKIAVSAQRLALKAAHYQEKGIKPMSRKTGLPAWKMSGGSKPTWPGGKTLSNSPNKSTKEPSAEDKKWKQHSDEQDAAIEASRKKDKPSGGKSPAWGNA